MSSPGWYPDPGGRAGHYRFWDGRTWAPTTTATPAGLAPPELPPGGRPSGPRPRRGRRIAAAVVAAVLVLAVVGALVYRSANRPIVDDGVSPSPSPSPSSSSPSSPASQPSGGETSASATPSSGGSVPPSPGEVPGAVPSAVPCPVGSPFSRQDYARDGRVHGGNLSFPRPSGWEDPGQQTSAFTWAYDVGDIDRRVHPQWFASYAVGALAVADGFEDPRSAAELSMQCTIHSALYSYVTSRTDLVDEETTVDGYPAWTLRSELRTYDARTSYGGDTVEITVVDLGSPEALAFFWGSAPLGDEALGEQLGKITQELRVG